jgi:hypothetical protein
MTATHIHIHTYIHTCIPGYRKGRDSEDKPLGNMRVTKMGGTRRARRSGRANKRGGKKRR